MPKNMGQRLAICSDIISYTPENHSPNLALAVGWLESRYTDAKGRWLCTNKGKLVKTKVGHKCLSTGKKSQLVRAEGPLQILKKYHCKGEPDCDTTLNGVRHLYKMVDKYGEKKGLAVYAGGYVNPKSKRYARYALKVSKKIKSLGLEDFELPLPKDISMFWSEIK